MGRVDNMYIKFSKENLSNFLPEKRPNIVFSNPDLFIVFDGQFRFVIWDDIFQKLNSFWLEEKDLWNSDFDFGADIDDYDKQFDDYKTVELLQFPMLSDLDIEEDFAFVFDKNNDLFISEKFIADLKSAGCVNVWYDTTAPFGRY